MGNIAEPGYSKENSAKTNAKTMGDTNKPEEAKGKIDITTLDKTNKTFILVSY